ncbi:hypothetical protein BpHYR1_030952 [Brachionus plicatilis]|uniref:Uncharacterized protein n=1 Tax=Brachionus plicatilis TaxID=10195 RepID=A0A3M7SWH1_BRAPC|nr:hypothetical protein BpHYR1_030952 [Brachionus plicatilis]
MFLNVPFEIGALFAHRTHVLLEIVVDFGLTSANKWTKFALVLDIWLWHHFLFAFALGPLVHAVRLLLLLAFFIEKVLLDKFVTSVITISIIGTVRAICTIVHVVHLVRVTIGHGAVVEAVVDAVVLGRTVAEYGAVLSG